MRADQPALRFSVCGCKEHSTVFGWCLCSYWKGGVSGRCIHLCLLWVGSVIASCVGRRNVGRPSSRLSPMDAARRPMKNSSTCFDFIFRYLICIVSSSNKTRLPRSTTYCQLSVFSPAAAACVLLLCAPPPLTNIRRFAYLWA